MKRTGKYIKEKHLPFNCRSSGSNTIANEVLGMATAVAAADDKRRN